ncbi:MAG TPA: hypothetical protein VGH28_01470 [Polyangiaceae bacterium]|jgi:hypothetical protein
MLAPDVRLEGFTAEDWTRLLHLFRPPSPDKTPSLGGIFLIHQEGRVRKMLHTRRGRLEREGEWRDWPSEPDAAQTKRFAALAEAQQASWVVAAQVGALDDVMERFGARAQRSDDLVDQSLSLVGIVREMMAEGRIEFWPRRFKNVPVPSAAMVRRGMDAFCKEGHAIAVGAFKDGELWTALALRRGARGFDLIAGPDELRTAMGLLSGEWRRDYRHLVAAVEDRYAPLALGCFGELDVLSALQADDRPGAWTRAVAVRDVVLSPMPVAVGVALGVDGARYAFEAIRAVVPISIPTPAMLGFNPLEILRALRRKE